MSGPTAGSAEMLAEALFAACCKVGPTVDTKDLAAELIASDWMKRHDAEVRAEVLREFARKWADWAANGSPQVRGGAAYRAVCEAQRIENPARTEEGDRG